MGADPGSVNFHVTIIKTSGTRFSILHGGFILCPITNLTDSETKKIKTRTKKETIFGETRKTKKKISESTMQPFHDQLETLSEWFDGLLAQYQVNRLCMERFQPRGISRGNLIEVIGITIGTLACLSQQHHAHCRLVLASQWKNNIENIEKGLLETLYSEGKPHKVTPHQIDSLCIALYDVNPEMLKCLTQKTSRQKVLKRLNEIAQNSI